VELPAPEREPCATRKDRERDEHGGKRQQRRYGLEYAVQLGLAGSV
jgi:hypothetical protein